MGSEIAWVFGNGRSGIGVVVEHRYRMMSSMLLDNWIYGRLQLHFVE